jgi:hypothetical protein
MPQPGSPVMMATMRALVTMSALGSLLVGCMAAPEAEELVLVDEDRQAMPELHAIPYDETPARAAPPVEAVPETEPEPVTEDEDEDEPATRRTPTRPRFIPDTGPDACWGVRAEGFPAISDDGTTLVVPQSHHLQVQLYPGDMGLEWRDVASGHVTRTEPVAIFDDGFFDQDGELLCGRLARSVRRRAHAANASLAAVEWRVMERLPVALPDLGISEVLHGEYLAQVPPRERVVQLVPRHGQVALRIPGVKVLERHALPIDDVVEVYGDRATGTVVLVERKCLGDSCTCDPGFTAHVVHWSPETFDTIAKRPCVAASEDVENESGSPTSCEAVELETGTPWAIASSNG